jgi:hypothetical protein
MLHDNCARHADVRRSLQHLRTESLANTRNRLLALLILDWFFEWDYMSYSTVLLRVANAP